MSVEHDDSVVETVPLVREYVRGTQEAAGIVSAMDGHFPRDPPNRESLRARQDSGSCRFHVPVSDERYKIPLK